MKHTKKAVFFLLELILFHYRIVYYCTNWAVGLMSRVFDNGPGG